MHLLIQQPGHVPYEVEVTTRFELIDLPNKARYASIGGPEHVSMQLEPGTTITILDEERRSTSRL